MRRPVDEPVNITGDRASHAAYGVGPATDYGCDIGTPVYAPFAGRLSTYVTDAGGLGVILWGADAAFYGQHLWVRMSPGDYAEADHIALTGNSGSQTTGPHLHCYVIVHATGERLAMEEYLNRAGVAGGGSRPFPTIEKEYPDMFIAIVNGNWHLVIPQGAAKPRGILLGGEALAKSPDIPILVFTDANAIMGLQTAVEGIFP